MVYTQSNTDPVSVNGMYLKLYTDLIRDISDDLKDGGNVQSFNLHSMLLRSTVIKPELRNDIDDDVIEMNKRIADGVYGETGKAQADYIRGFCIVSAAMKFIGDAFHIIQNDSTSLADITDDDLMIAVEREAMRKTVRQAFVKDKEKMRLMELRIAEGSIPDMKGLVQELTTPDEFIPQDDLITQEAAVNTSDEYDDS